MTVAFKKMDCFAWFSKLSLQYHIVFLHFAHVSFRAINQICVFVVVLPDLGGINAMLVLSHPEIGSSPAAGLISRAMSYAVACKWTIL